MGDNAAMSRFRFLVLFLLLQVLAMPVFAWNAAGHRLVAKIAWLELSPGARARIAEILAAHPDHERWMRQKEGEAAENAFIEASTWPDDIRRDPRFYDEDSEAPTPGLPGLADTRRHLRWHYLDLPLHGGKKTGDGELDVQLARLLQRLAVSRERAELSYILPWIIHLVADVHQPLHVASDEDEGGNRHDIADPFNPRLPLSNLHRWWDDRPGPPWLRGSRLDRAAARILREHPAAPPQGNLAHWLEESRRLARDHAYPPAIEQPPVITEAFKQTAERITRECLVSAGRRLARLLEQRFAVPRGTE